MDKQCVKRKENMYIEYIWCRRHHTDNTTQHKTQMSVIDDAGSGSISVDLEAEVDGEKGNKTFRDVEWHEEHEKILIDWADKAMCYRWLHAQAHQKYASLTRWYTIPVIVISTITGTANFAQDRFPKDWANIAVMSIGALSLIAGIITTIRQFLQIGELNEAHRVSAIAWDKFYRNTKVELAKSPKERIPVVQMIKMCKEEFDRLMESSPTIQNDIIKRFNHTFKNSPHFEKIHKPEICDELVTTENIRYNGRDSTTAIVGAAAPFAAMLKRKKEMEQQRGRIKEFMSQFEESQGRQPMQDEIIEKFKESINEKRISSLVNMIMKKEEPAKAAAASLVNKGKGLLSDVADKYKMDHSDDEKESAFVVPKGSNLGVGLGIGLDFRKALS